MLGRLEMTVDECIDAYVRMMDAVFKKTNHRFKNLKGATQGRFDTAALEDAVKQTIREAKVAGGGRMKVDAPMRNDSSACKTYVIIRAHNLMASFVRFFLLLIGSPTVSFVQLRRKSMI